MQLFEFSIAGVVRVSGEDALPYLQSQLTINLNQISVLGTRPGLRLSLKGKVLFGAQVIRTGEEEYLLVCRDTPASAVIGLLEENIVAEPNTLRCRTEQSHGRYTGRTSLFYLSQVPFDYGSNLRVPSFHSETFSYLP